MADESKGPPKPITSRRIIRGIVAIYLPSLQADPGRFGVVKEGGGGGEPDSGAS